MQLYGLITDTSESVSGFGNTELSVPPASSVSVAASDGVCAANAHDPPACPLVQIKPVSPLGDQEIPPARGAGGAGVFAAPVG